MKRKFTFLIAAAVMLLTMVATTSEMWGQTREDYSVTYNYSDLGSMLSGNYTDASSYWKVPGTAGNNATIAIPITNQPTSDITITFNIATFGSGNNPSSSNTTITAVGTETGSNWSGSAVSSYPSSSTYVNGVMTITKPANPTTLEGLTITMGVNTGVKIFRLKSITVSYTYGGSPLQPCDLALTNAPIALGFDLYDNNDPQVINYTTSSTGAVTVSTSNYVTTEVNANAKTITVTPTAITPSVQTITVNQAADATYAAGSATFTVSITDSTPFNGVIFNANEDTGTSSIVKDNVSFACDNGVLNNESEYRLYKNSTTNISTTDGSTITKIEFTGVSGYAASNFTTQSGWATSGNDGVWTGEAESVSFVASGGQVRATVIRVSVLQNTNPSITADDVNISCDATNGSITYEINNPVDGGSLSAATTADWITLSNNFASPIAFTCNVNATAAPRTATVILTYTYETRTEVTKEVIITQAGNPNNPYTVAEARAAIDAGTGINNVYATGIVSQVDTYNQSYHSITYWISSDGETNSDQLQIYSGKSFNGENFNSINDIQVSDVVVVFGNLTKFNDTYEFTANNQLVSLFREPVITATPSPFEAPSYQIGTANPTSANLTVNGINLTANIVATLNENSDFEMSYNSGSWTNSITLQQNEGSVTDAIIAIRLKTGLAQGNHNGTITLSTTGLNESVTVNLSGTVAEHTYDIVVTQPATGGTIEADKESAAAGATVTLTATPEAAYNFGSWVVEDEDENPIVVNGNPGSFTMPAKDVLVTATFTLKPTYAITCVYDVNEGLLIADPENAYAGQTVTLEHVPETGYMLTSIVITKTSDGSATGITPVQDGDNFIFEMPGYPVTATASFLAVVTDVLTPTSIGVYTNQYTAWPNPLSWTSDAVYTGKTSGGDNNASKIQLRVSGNDCGIVTTVSGGKVKKVKVVWNSSGSNTVLDIYGRNSAYSAATDLFNTNSDGSKVGSITKGTSTELTINNDTVTYIGLRSSSGTIYLNEIHIMWEYVFPEDGGTITHNTTIPENVIINETNVTIPDNMVLTVDGVLNISGTLTNNGDETNLIINDGGQVVVNNTGVQATFKKSVAHSGAKDAANWYTISSPVNNIATASVNNLIQDPATKYDLYYYDEATQMWKNHKANAITNMTNGRGYLYWNTDGDELSFPGELNSGTVEIAVTKTGTGDLAGFNLIGNPYPHNIYKGDGTAIPNSNLTAGYYTLSNAGAWTAGTDNTTAIKPGQGILVKATSAGTVTMTNTTANGAKRSNNDYIKLIVANSQYEDVAYALFNKEEGLNKINHRNADIPMLYIPQDGQNYAIATMSDETQSFNLNLRAMTTGQYTLSFKAEGKYDYLHVIDRMTGEDIDMLLDGEYSFIASPSDNDARFIVKLGYNANSNADNDIFAFQNGNDIIVNGEGELQVFDVTGRMVATQHVNGVQTVNVPSQGVFIFKLNEKTQKIVVR